MPELCSVANDATNDPALKEAYDASGIGYAYRNGTDTEALVAQAEGSYRAISSEAGVQKETAN